MVQEKHLRKRPSPAYLHFAILDHDYAEMNPTEGREVPRTTIVAQNGTEIDRNEKPEPKIYAQQKPRERCIDHRRPLQKGSNLNPGG
jgi:hypothetical protein